MSSDRGHIDFLTSLKLDDILIDHKYHNLNELECIVVEITITYCRMKKGIREKNSLPVMCLK